jgi:hypothetical protein
MTAKEKAKELVSKFNFEHTGQTYILHQTVDESKRCAIITINELLTLITYQPSIDYYLEVKQEIQNL